MAVFRGNCQERKPILDRKENRKTTESNGKTDSIEEVENILTRIAEGVISPRQKIDSLITSENELEALVEIILTKVTTGINYILPRLASFCKENQSISVLFDGIKKTTLRALLVGNIVESFNRLINLENRVYLVASKYKGPAEKKQKWMECQFKKLILPLEHTAYKNAEFIQCLFSEQMVSSTFLLNNISSLSKMKRSVSLKLLYELLKYNGKSLENDARKTLEINEEFNHVFTRISALADGNMMSERARTILKAIIELKESDWTSRYHI